MVKRAVENVADNIAKSDVPPATPAYGVITTSSSSSSSLKKSSPMKHVTPIIKKYDCQRQAKNGKSVKKIKSQGKKMEADTTFKNPTPVQNLVAGMGSLDAALRRAEKHLAGDQCEFSSENPIEASTDDIGDVEEEVTSTSNAASNQQISSNVRTSKLRSRNRVLKKRNQLQKDLEHALPLAEPDQSSISEERSLGYAIAFFQKVRDRFEVDNNPIFVKFQKLMEDFNNFSNLTDWYHKLMELFEGHPDLCEEFLGCLLPFQALQCGKFMEHLALMEMSSFVRKMELHFSKQPQHIRKIHATWARLAETSDVSLETVRSTILPLLRGNTFLIDSFQELFPSEKPPESKMTDFDQVKCEDMDSEHSGEEDTYERVEIPPENDDRFGGENCQCCCHDSTDSAFHNRTKHCMPCGMKFISGKVFLQTEHGLRPVRIDFHGSGNNSTNIKRLNADHQKLSRSRSRRSRINTPQSSSKPEEKPSVETDDEASFSNKTKSPRQRPKINRQAREKPTSARSLSLNRTGCPRKTTMNKCNSSSSPVALDPEVSPSASISSGTDKSTNLDFSRISNVLQADQSRKDKEESRENIKGEITENSNDKTGVDITNIKDNKIVDTDVLMPEMKEEEIKHEVGIDNTEQGEVFTHTSEEKAEDGAEDRNTDSNIDVSGASSDCDVEALSEDGGEKTWTREEDRIILCTFQSEPNKDKTLQKIRSQIPHRSIDEISSRFQCLMSLIQQMT